MRKKSASPAIEKRSELFYSGRDCRAYDYMGAHPFVQDGEQGYLFRVYAPEAANVSVMGEFNGWDREADYMTRDEQGIWGEIYSEYRGIYRVQVQRMGQIGRRFRQVRPVWLPLRDPPGQRHQGV